MIEYKVNPEISVDDFIETLNRSGLGERRPVNDTETIKGMLENADIIVTAYDNNKIAGIARAVTDYRYCCYLSDLAVDKEYQHRGIGKTLISKLKQKLHKNCKIILLSAPAATEYYPKIGFEKHNSAWVLK
jgi:ribosomal protein S18 acetylase RimI-like enzyme